VYPDATVLVLALVLGIGLAVSGAIQIGAAAAAPRGSRGRGWAVLLGLLSTFAGVLCLFSPGVGVLALVFGAALWFAVVGVDDLKREAGTSDDRAWNIALGVLSLLAAVLLLGNPGVAVDTIALLAGITLIIRGALVIALAARMRSVSRATRA
jgi:uncharacterized membrane protein HdeD (DUF308 family)